MMRGAVSVAHTVGSREATTLDWDALYVKHSQGIARYLARLTGDRDVAPDLTQEVFGRALGHADGSTIRDPRAWLYRIATNLGIQYCRRRRLLAFVRFSGRERAEAGSHDRTELVRQALQAIATDQAVALVLHYHEGFSRREAAALLGVPEGTVKTRLARGRRNFIGAYRRLERGLAR